MRNKPKPRSLDSGGIVHYQKYEPKVLDSWENQTDYIHSRIYIYIGLQCQESLTV